MNKLLEFVKENKKLSFVLILSLALLLVFSLYNDTGSEGVKTALSEYESLLENQISTLCSSVKGVGKCKIEISFESGEENVYKGGALIETKPPRVLGVAVVCEGGDNASVRSELTELLTALFDIGTNRVKILKLK